MMKDEVFFDFLRQSGASRETEEKFRIYARLLLKWQKSINLIGASTIDVSWERHFLDSAQITPYLPPGAVLDMGSGAGFPGLVLALLRNDPVFLVESNQRKNIFLLEVIRETEANAIIINNRLEKTKPFSVKSITARALAPLHKLLSFAEPFITSSTECFFFKGKNVEEELTDAMKIWNMRVQRISSRTDSQALILHLKEVCRV